MRRKDYITTPFENDIVGDFVGSLLRAADQRSMTAKDIGLYLYGWVRYRNGARSKLPVDEYQRRLSAYCATDNNVDMAEQLGLSHSTVRNWRIRRCLPVKGTAISGVKKGNIHGKTGLV